MKKDIKIRSIINFIYRYFKVNILDFIVYAFFALFIVFIVSELLLSLGEDYEHELLERIIMITKYYFVANFVYAIFKIIVVEFDKNIHRLRNKKKNKNTPTQS